MDVELSSTLRVSPSILALHLSLMLEPLLSPLNDSRSPVCRLRSNVL
jgi:hypothetical protein